MMLQRFDDLVVQLRDEVVRLLEEHEKGETNLADVKKSESQRNLSSCGSDRRIKFMMSQGSEFELPGSIHSPQQRRRSVVRGATLGARGLKAVHRTDDDMAMTRVATLRQLRVSPRVSLPRIKFRCTPPKLPLDPETSAYLRWWDVATVFGLVWVATVIPVQLCFGDAIHDTVLFVLGVAIDTIFFADSLLQFVTMYPSWTSRGFQMESNRRKIVRHYLTTWFTIDLVSIIPFDLIASWTEQSVGNMRLMKIIRLARMLKLVRMVRASRLFRRFELRMSITYRTIALAKFFVMLVLVTHWLACLWCTTLNFVDATDGVPRWIDVFADVDAHVKVKTEDSPFKIYVNALYFTTYTITTVGYGDIGPQNIVETVTCLLMLLVAGISWAIILGEVCGIIANMHPDERAFRKTMDDLNQMMHDRVLAPDIRRRLRSFFLSKKAVLCRERQTALLDAMSPGLHGEVIMHTNRVWLEKVPFLETVMGLADPGSFYHAFLVDVAASMKFEVYAEREIFGDDHTLYILTRGLAIIRLVTPMTRKVRDGLIIPGSAWGTDFMLVDSSLQEPCEVRALSYVECMRLQRETFMQIVESHVEYCPGIQRKLRWYMIWLAFQRELFREARGKKRQTLEFEASPLSRCASPIFMSEDEPEHSPAQVGPSGAAQGSDVLHI